MSCSTRSGTREFVEMLEAQYETKLSQDDWHGLREWASNVTDVSRRKLSDKEIYDTLEEYTDFIVDQERGDFDKYEHLPLFHGAYDQSLFPDEYGYADAKATSAAEDRTMALVEKIRGKVTEGTLNTITNLPHRKEEFMALLEQVREKRRHDAAKEKYRGKWHRDDKADAYKRGVTKDGVAGGCSPSGLVAVEFVDLDEGYNGEYDPNDPEDAKLLRFDAYIKRTPSTTFNEENGLGENDHDDYKGGWAMRENSSFCTQVPADTPKGTLHAIARGIATGLDRTLDQNPQEWKHTASLFSHLSGDMNADKEVFDSTRDKSHLAVNWGSSPDQDIIDALTR